MIGTSTDTRTDETLSASRLSCDQSRKKCRQPLRRDTDYSEYKRKDLTFFTQIIWINCVSFSVKLLSDLPVFGLVGTR